MSDQPTPNQDEEFHYVVRSASYNDPTPKCFVVPVLKRTAKQIRVERCRATEHLTTVSIEDWCPTEAEAWDRALRVAESAYFKAKDWAATRKKELDAVRRAAQEAARG